MKKSLPASTIKIAMTAKVAWPRLVNAVQAMSDVHILSAAEWNKKYHDFSRAVEQSPFRPATEDKWFAEVTAMQIELQLRMAEYLLTLPNPAI